MGKNILQVLKHHSADVVTQNGHKFDTNAAILYANTRRPQRRLF